jgi:FkbM family methyltransferase
VDLGAFRLYVPPDDVDVGQALIERGAYEPHVTAAIRSHLGPTGVFVDVGAYVGYFSLLAASLVGPSGRVVSVEPNSTACALLQSSARLNGFGQIELWPVAVAEERRVFALIGRGGHGRLVDWSPSADAPTPPSLVVALTLDEVLGDAARVDVIKLDVEGAEARVLRGARRTLATHRPVLVTEFAPAALANVSGVSGEAYLRQLAEAGYAVAVLQEDGESLPCGTDPGPVMRALAAHPSPRIDLLARPR